MAVTDQELEEARQLGREAARYAASWTSDAGGDPSFVLEMIENGDPEVEQYLPARPDLSGEWADAPTPNSVVRDVRDMTGLTIDDVEPEDRDAIAEAWEEGVVEAFEPQCERILRAALA